MKDHNKVDVVHLGLRNWKELVAAGAAERLNHILAEDVVFHSPVVHTPQKGKAVVRAYLAAAMQLLNHDEFSYTREFISGREVVLEFETEVNGIHINGIDMIRWNVEGQIDDFKVMIRPLKAVNLIHQMMMAALEKGL